MTKNEYLKLSAAAKENKELEKENYQLQKENKSLRQFYYILLDLVHDYLSFMDTLPDEQTQERKKDVATILQRMIEDHELSTSTETPAQSKGPEKKRSGTIQQQDNQTDN
jgi:hypothetical protein